ncbi:MAG TPA: hypothetical protein VK165_11330 [Azonexus sp.]|nr:hypothetical protein [Azonexus sp.]
MGGKISGHPLWRWVKLRFLEHPGSSLLSLAFAVGGILMLTHFVHIKYLPSIDLKSATGILLGVAMAGTLTIGSMAILLGIPGALMQLCVRYKVLNPGTQDLNKEGESPERRKRKGNGRGNFMLHIYASVAIALFLLFGPYYFGAAETFFAWQTMSVIICISAIFLFCVVILVVRYREGGPVKRLARIRFRNTCGRTHGLWILGFLTLFQISVCAFLVQIFPFFRQDSDLVGLMNFGLAISLSCAFGIAIHHNWKSAAMSIGAIIFLLVLLFDGVVQISEAVIKTLKLGNLENATLLVSTAGCQIITGTLGCGHCSSSNGAEAPVFRIQGLKILSRVGEEHLLAFSKEQEETRFLLRSPEVISISYPAQNKQKLPSTPAMPPACVTVMEVSILNGTASKRSN